MSSHMEGGLSSAGVFKSLGFLAWGVLLFTLEPLKNRGAAVLSSSLLPASPRKGDSKIVGKVASVGEVAASAVLAAILLALLPRLSWCLSGSESARRMRLLGVKLMDLFRI